MPPPKEVMHHLAPLRLHPEPDELGQERALLPVEPLGAGAVRDPLWGRWPQPPGEANEVGRLCIRQLIAGEEECAAAKPAGVRPV